MNFAAGLPWVPVPSGGFPIQTDISEIIKPVQTAKTETVLTGAYKKTSDVIPGVVPIETGNIKDKASSMWQALLGQAVLSQLQSGSGSGSSSGSGLAGAIKVPWEGSASPATSGATGGKSGDISGGVHYGDLVAKGMLFDLSSVPSWFWAFAAAGSVVGFLLLKKSGGKGKR